MQVYETPNKDIISQFLSGGDENLPDSLEIFVYDEVGSTNDLAKEYAEAHTGVQAVFIADSQTHGRGQRERTFFSPKGSGMYVTLLIRPSISAESLNEYLTCMAAVAICRAIEETTGISVQIKRVNDIYMGGRKICGILTESRLNPDNNIPDYVVIGIGLNLYEPVGGFPGEIKNTAAALYSAPPRRDIKNELYAAIICSFFEYYNKSDKASVLEEYESRINL